MEGIAWKLQSVDGAMIKAPLAREAVGRNPTDREKKGSKRHLLVDGHSVPLSLIVTGANRHDVSQLTALLDAIVIALPKGKQRFLYVDKGYDGEPAREQIRSRGYTQGSHERSVHAGAP
jgi:IS5 family transposase